MTEPEEEAPDLRHLTAADLDPPEPNRPEDDDTLGPEDDDEGLLAGMDPPPTPDLGKGYPVDPGTEGGYEVEPGDEGGYPVDEGGV